jgi:hypothetical protein
LAQAVFHYMFGSREYWMKKFGVSVEDIKGVEE